MTKEQVVEAIKGMSVLGLNELVKTCGEELGASAAAPVTVVGGAAAGTTTEERSEFGVVLTNAGANEIKVIKAVRGLTDLGLEETKEIVDGTPKALKEVIAKEEAEDMKARLAEAGTEVELK